MGYMRNGDNNGAGMTDDNDENRDEAGRYTDKYPREDILAAIRDLSGMAATSEVADRLDADRNTIYKKLSAMQEDGELDSRMAGGIRVWSVADAE